MEGAKRGLCGHVQSHTLGLEAGMMDGWEGRIVEMGNDGLVLTDM